MVTQLAALVFSCLFFYVIATIKGLVAITPKSQNSKSHQASAQEVA